MVRSLWLLVSIVGVACVELTPAGARVPVFTAPLDAPADRRAMPAGCRFVSSSPKVWMTELEMEGSKDPYRVQRNRAGAAGANALLVLSRMRRSRRDFECPSGVPITDCGSSSGAEFDVVFESYACTAEALHALASAAPTNRVTGR